MRASGFTLIEILAALAVAAVLLAVALPTWSRARAAAESGAVRVKLAGTLVDAVRYSAIAGTEVVVCPNVGAGQCAASTNWDRGWIAFADINRNRLREANETVLSGGDPLKADVHLRSTEGRTRLIFQPSGGNAGSNITFTLCDSRGPDAATTLVLSNIGGLRVGKPAAAAAWNCAHGG